MKSQETTGAQHRDQLAMQHPPLVPADTLAQISHKTNRNSWTADEDEDLETDMQRTIVDIAQVSVPKQGGTLDVEEAEDNNKAGETQLEDDKVAEDEDAVALQDDQEQDEDEDVPTASTSHSRRNLMQQM